MCLGTNENLYPKEIARKYALTESLLWGIKPTTEDLGPNQACDVLDGCLLPVQHHEDGGGSASVCLEISQKLLFLMGL